MRRHRVRITDKALADVDAVLAWFAEQSAGDAAERWFNRLMAKLETLETFPERCGQAAEAAELGLDLRETLVGKRQGTHRILFQIDGGTVTIIRIWHASRDTLTHDDL